MITLGRAFFLVSTLSLVAACGDDDRRGCTAGMSVDCTCSDGDMGTQTCQADGTYSSCNCGARPPARLDGGPSGADTGSTVSCVTDFANTQIIDDERCVAAYNGCSNAFTYSVVCMEGTCTCRENDIAGSTFPTSNFCGNITSEFQAGLATMNCGWDWSFN